MVPGASIRHLALGLLAALLLAGCEARQPAFPDRELPPRQSVRLLDQAGHRVQLARPAERIGTPGVSMASLVLALGGPERLVAVAAEVNHNPWLAHIMPELASRPAPFIRPAGVHLESLLTLKPDLVTLWLGNQSQGEKLEQLGIPVMYLGYRSPEEMRQAVLLLGQALGERGQTRAEAFVGYYEASLTRVRAGLAGLSDAARPRVYYASISPLHTEGRDSMIDAWIRTAGGINVAAATLRGDGQVQLENLLTWDPDLIITLGLAQQQAILADPRWQQLRAVRQGRVIVNPRGINAWCTRAAETALQVLWAARLFHPERFADLDMAMETRRFYRQFYAYELSDDEVARVLQGRNPTDPQP